MSKIRVGIVGVGNCASSLIQGTRYYKDADPSGTVPGPVLTSLTAVFGRGYRRNVAPVWTR